MLEKKNVSYLSLLFFLYCLPILSQETLISTKKENTSKIELGIRFGENFSLDAILPFHGSTRLHPSATINDAGVVLGSYIDWVWDLNQANGLKIYPGVGPELWFYNGFDIGISGDFGLEYTFNIPLTLGFDWRPGFTIINYHFRTNNWGFIARYIF